MIILYSYMCYADIKKAYFQVRQNDIIDYQCVVSSSLCVKDQRYTYKDVNSGLISAFNFQETFWFGNMLPKMTFISIC